MNIENKYEGFVTPKDGELTFNNQVERDLFEKFLRTFDGEDLWLEIESDTPKRTARQNRFYWVYLEKISQKSGHSPEELHMTFKHNFLEPKERQGIKKNYKERPTTTDLTKGEFSEYIKNIEMTTGISAPSRKRYGLGA